MHLIKLNNRYLLNINSEIVQKYGNQYSTYTVELKNQ